MKTYDAKCPFCRTINKDLYLEETDGLMECEKCGRVIPAKLVILVKKLPQYDDQHITHLNLTVNA